MSTGLDILKWRKKWRNSLLNAEAYNTFASVGSDHRIVSARVRLSLRKSKTLQRKKQHDWNLLCTDSNLQELYSIEVCNRFQPSLGKCRWISHWEIWKIYYCKQGGCWEINPCEKEGKEGTIFQGYTGDRSKKKDQWCIQRLPARYQWRKATDIQASEEEPWNYLQWCGWRRSHQ